MEIGYHRFSSGKEYVYVMQHGHPVFLRNIMFIVNATDPHKIAVVREWGADHNNAVWEPPKGQMEWKEFSVYAGIRPHTKIKMPTLVRYMRAGILREIGEEAQLHANELKNIRILPVNYMEDWPESGIKGAKFMYQYWEAEISPKIMDKAQSRMNLLVTNKDWKGMLPPDMTEKNAIRWWSPANGWGMIRGAFSKKMTQHYFKALTTLH